MRDDPQKKIPVGVLGATGMVGQHYLERLRGHPWFEVKFLAASELSAGRNYGEAVSGRWHMPTPLESKLASQRVHSLECLDDALASCEFVFSAMTNEAAERHEERYAAAGLPVISNASFHRHTPDVPMLIPEVNPEQSAIIPIQQKNRGWDKGFIAVKPNCSLQSYMIPLGPLHERYGVKRLIVTTMQALSGAGYPGVSAWDITDNVIPYIAKEEEKSESEPLKIWGKISGNKIEDAKDIAISAHCNRVAVLDGHLACVEVEFEEKPAMQEILSCWDAFMGVPQEYKLPSAPERVIIYNSETNRPQPRLDRGAGNGMAVTVGRLRPSAILHYRFVALSHNTIRGAAGGGILNAELLLQQGFLKRT